MFSLKKHIKSQPLLISIIIILIGIFAYFAGIPFLDLVELKTIDLRFETRGKISPNPEIVLAVIDEKSIAREGKWIWPRSKIADLVTKLSKAGARVIAFDIGFLEPDNKKVFQVIENIETTVQDLDIQDKRIENYLKKLKAQSDNDKLLADAIANSDASVVLGYFFQMDPESAKHLSEKDISTHQKNITGSGYSVERYVSDDARNVPLIEALIPQSNIKSISDATDYSGFFNMLPDKDGVMRRLPAVLKFKESLYAPLSLITVSAIFNAPLSVKVAEYGVEEVRIGGLSIPVDELGRILINYRGKEKTFPHISVTDILNENTPVDLLKDRIVIVGATAVGIYDLRVTPFGSVFPGLEIHANIVDSILSEDFMYQPAWAGVFDIAAIIVGGLFLGIVLSRSGVIFGAATGSFLFFGYIMLCRYLFSEKGLILNLVYPLSVMLLVYVGITAYKYFTESRQKRFIENAFSTYLAPAVVKQLIKFPETLELGGEEREITAFFSDVQGFTSISEKLTPKELVELLNEFLTEMTDIILNYEGTVDKFEGDAIIAFFGAPNKLDNHAKTACMASIEMQKRLTELRTTWKAKNKPELKMRIGLYSGSAVVGNMGSKSRMDYTMMGDTVNIAARLEGVNKIYGTYTLIGETTCRAAGDSVMAREIDLINVVGKKEPVAIYQLSGYPKDNNDRMIETVDYYARGLCAYRNQDWEKAVNFFKKALKITPDDGPCRTMLLRCDEFKANPPGKDWNGSFIMKTK